MNRILAPVLAGMALVASIAACAHEESMPTTPAAAISGPLLSVEWRGGLCPYGGCSITLDVDADGAYRLVERGGAARTGVLEPALVAALADAVARADFDAVRVHGSTETCPTAYDGQEIIYTFHAPRGDERMSTCEDVIELDRDPLPQTLAVIEAVR